MNSLYCVGKQTKKKSKPYYLKNSSRIDGSGHVISDRKDTEMALRAKMYEPIEPLMPI